MKQLLTLIAIATTLSVSAQTKDTAATMQTPLLTYADFQELHKTVAAEFKESVVKTVLLNWIEQRFQQRAQEYKQSLKSAPKK